MSWTRLKRLFTDDGRSNHKLRLRVRKGSGTSENERLSACRGKTFWEPARIVRLFGLGQCRGGPKARGSASRKSGSHLRADLDSAGEEHLGWPALPTGQGLAHLLDESRRFWNFAPGQLGSSLRVFSWPSPLACSRPVRKTSYRRLRIRKRGFTHVPDSDPSEF